MTQTYIYIAVAFAAGFILASLIQLIAMGKVKKENKSMKGYLESEKLKKETLQKENIHVHNSKQIAEMELQKKLKEVVDFNKQMDMDILLLQKNNEETEALLQAGEPEIHALKLKLIEANNTIARYKAQLDQK